MNRYRPRQHRTRVNDVELAWVEWGNPGDPLIVMAHATGLHSRCWDRTVRHLDGYHVIAPDHRGHGQSENNPPFGWNQFGTDLTAFIVALDLRDISGVGHSMGGHTIVQAAATEQGRFRQLALFDPVIFEPSIYSAKGGMTGVGGAVAKRRNDWASPEQMVAKFKDRTPFSRWHPDVLGDYCRHGLVRAGDQYELACPPEIEAGIYASALDANIHEHISDIEIPVTVVRAEARGLKAARADFSVSPTWPKLASRFASGKDRYLPEFSHFMPMENPELAASIIEAEFRYDRA